jgi:hypothetical protein
MTSISGTNDNQPELDMFTDALKMTLTLEIGDMKFEIPGANIKSLKATLHPYGFTAHMGFGVSSEKVKDTLYSQFVKQDLIRVKLDVEPYFKPRGERIETLTLQGFVTGKSLLKELTIENINLRRDPVLYRFYLLDFADPARVLWRRHFPCDLVVDKNIKDLIEANKGTGVDIHFEGERLDEKFAIQTLTPGAFDTGNSFYDFIVWYANAYNSIFSYNFKTNHYTLSESKPKEGEVKTVSELEVEEYRIDFPDTIRYNDRFLNVFSEDPRISEKSRDTAKQGFRRDVLLRESVASEFENACNLESEKPKIRGHVLFVTHKRFPLLTYRPGIFVKLEGGLWSDKIFLHGKEYRVRDIFMKVQAEDDNPDADHNMPFSRYHLDLHSRLELKSEKAATMPPFKAPVYPIHVEGKIVSEQGKDKEETYQIYKHHGTEIDQYKVKIPCFGNVEVVAPFEPLFEPGHFYFPAYKDQRVLVELYFHSARIVGFLDWRHGGRLPMDTQGNHILFGKSSESNTSINHIYVDNKPQLNIKRSSNKDTETIQLQEGTIILQTKDEN